MRWFLAEQGGRKISIPVDGARGRNGVRAEVMSNVFDRGGIPVVRAVVIGGSKTDIDFEDDDASPEMMALNSLSRAFRALPEACRGPLVSRGYADAGMKNISIQVSMYAHGILVMR